MNNVYAGTHASMSMHAGTELSASVAPAGGAVGSPGYTMCHFPPRYFSSFWSSIVMIGGLTYTASCRWLYLHVTATVQQRNFV